MFLAPFPHTADATPTPTQIYKLITTTPEPDQIPQLEAPLLSKYMSEFIADCLSDVYFDVDSAKARYAALTAFFSAQFDGAHPSFIVRSPGRVNIIGDHIDYSFFSCLPAAISFDVVMAVQTVPGSDCVELVNMDDRFPREKFDALPEIPIFGRSWVNYFKCSWITGLRYLHAHKLRDRTAKPCGLRIVVTGNVPAGGGLSSSAAFVVSGLLATLQANSSQPLSISKSTLTELSATCEQLVGVNSGGMDQSASIFGEKDYALQVSFQPKLDVRPLQFAPREDPLVFLIANSLVVVNKLDSAPIHYNLRVVEVTLAANILAKKMGDLVIPLDGNLRAGTLHGVLTAKYGAVNKHSLAQMVAEVDKHLEVGGYTEAEAANALNISVSTLRARFMADFTVKFDKLQLLQRAKHVFMESLRVLQFTEAMASDASPLVLGNLMNESQKSAQQLFMNSHPDCDEMCRIAQQAGALGSRVTGAGWGGCTVHLVTRSSAQRVRAALKQQFYDIRHPHAPPDALIETRPGSGTALFLTESG